MRRRAVLRRLGSVTALGVAGCLSGPAGTPQADTDPPEGTATASESPTPRETGDDTSTPREADGTPGGATPTPTSPVPREVALVSLDDAALRSTYGVAASAAVVEPRVTGEHTATVRIALRNRGERDRTPSYVARTCDLNLLSGGLVGGDAGLLLAPADRAWEPVSEDCWRAGHRHVGCGIPATTHEVDLPAGGGVEWRFDLFATPRGECMPPGRYRFRRVFDDGAAALSLVLAVSVPDS